MYGGISGHKYLGGGIYGMAGGDGNADGTVNDSDKNNIWFPKAGYRGYLNGDFSLDSEVNNVDKNDIWTPNIGMGSHVPE